MEKVARTGWLASSSKKMMKKSFGKTRYNYRDIPVAKIGNGFGIYVHVPFCHTKCSFCPFYKELYDEKKKEKYLDAICREIGESSMEGKARWLYFGGGTPNTLTIEELRRVLTEIRKKAKLDNIGIELLPALLDPDYLTGLKELGFTKVSIGIESLSKKVMRKTGRKLDKARHTKDMIEKAKSSGLMVNVDIMIGLPGQEDGTFDSDIKTVSRIKPDQVTIYPFMIIRGLEAEPSMPDNQQFMNIEKAWDILEKAGYKRKGVWTFCQGRDVYDSSRDELVRDYIGFGPAAFSTYGDWKIVNPELDVYLNNMNNGDRKAFIARKTKGADEWRKFAGMIYDLRCKRSPDLPAYVNLYIAVLNLARYGKKGKLTPKGKIFAHALTKTVVESLPFPVQNPEVVDNYGEYLAGKIEVGE